MEDTLKPLLAAEAEAERQVAAAEEARQQRVDSALATAREAQAQSTARLPRMREEVLAKAGERAEQTLGELHRRYQERRQQLREQAETNQAEALAAAVAWLSFVPHA